MILDIHTHHPVPQPQAIVSLLLPGPEITATSLLPGQFYSVGIHPKDVGTATEDDWRQLRTLAENPQVKALGDCGIDLDCEIPMSLQINAFNRQIEIAEEVGKPMVIHDVRAHAEIIGCKKAAVPKQPWIIHGYRGKPSVTEMLLKSDMMFSIGQHYNIQSLALIPHDRIFAETDEAKCDILSVIFSLSSAIGRNMKNVVDTNVLRVFFSEENP